MFDSTDTSVVQRQSGHKYSKSFKVPFIVDPMNMELSLSCGSAQLSQIDGAVCPSGTLVTTGWWLSGALISEVGFGESA